MNEKFAQPKILIVDDVPENIAALGNILTEYRRVVSLNGEKALQKAMSENPPDLILLDIMMPELDGYDVCRRLKADERTRDIPVIFLSALDDAADKVKAFAVGGVDYITKPFQPTEVLARVKNHLTIRQLQRQLQDSYRREQERRQELQETLESLQRAQSQLIAAEKMAALGKLIANIAHEINTPLAAIQASGQNSSHAFRETLRHLPVVVQRLAPSQQLDFIAFVERALQAKQPLTSREERNLRKQLRHELHTAQIPQPDDLADILVDLGIYADLTPFQSLLQNQSALEIMQTVYHLAIQQHSINNILLAVERTSKVVTALKSYADDEDAGQQVAASIPDGIEIALTLYQNQLKQGIEVHKQYEALSLIDCYPDRLNQVWIHLIHNAIWAMQGKGRLEILVTRAPAAEAANELLLIQITDSGCGIPEGIKDRIFEPFFTTKPAGEGSGLGLDICKRIIDKHQGQISVASQPGRTTFTVTLPMV